MRSIPIEYWSVDVRLTPEGDRAAVPGTADPRCPRASSPPSPDKKGLLLGAEADAAQHVERLRAAPATASSSVEQKERKRSPAPPFTTSTLQQEAARKLGSRRARP